MIKMIVAVDRGNAIGWADGRLAWNIPSDMKRFKELTLGSTVVMGRSTYVSLNSLNGLPSRKNVVLTRRPYSEVRHQFGDVDIISSLDYVERNRSANTQWIIGGASVYAEALDRQMVDEIYVTLIDGTSGADVTLKHDLASWKHFIIRRRAFGENWYPTIMEGDKVSLSGPGTTYLTLKKVYAQKKPGVLKTISSTVTPEMIEAAENVEDLYRRGTPETWAKVFRAMIAAQDLS